MPSSPPRSRPADSISRNDEVGEPVSGDVSNMEPASNPGCFYSFVAFDAGPMPGRVAVWLFGTVTDDVERTVAALEIGVAVPQVLGGPLDAPANANSLKVVEVTRTAGARVIQRIFSGIEFSACSTCTASSLAALSASLE